MTVYYVDDGGTSPNNGSSWAAAYTSLSALDDAVTFASGDIVYVGHDHVCQYTHSANRTITGPTSGAPVLVISATQGSDPPTYAKSTSNQIDTSEGAYNITLDGSFAFYGIVFYPGASVIVSNDADELLHFYECTFKPAHAKGVSASSTYSNCLMVACEISCARDTGSTGERIFNWDSGSQIPNTPIVMIGGSITNLTNRTGSIALGQACDLFGVDLSAMPAEMELSGGNAVMRLVGCKFANTVTVNTTASTSKRQTIEVYNSKLGGGESDRLNYLVNDWRGTIVDDQDIVLTGGATADDGNGGTQAFSHKYVATSLCDERRPFSDANWFYVWNDTTGTRNLDIYVAAAETLDNSEIWAEYLYLGTASSEHYSLATTQRAAPTTAAATYTTTGGTWTGTGAPTEEYYLRSTVTINEKGWVMGRVCVGKASLTAWVDPRIVLS